MISSRHLSSARKLNSTPALPLTFAEKTRKGRTSEEIQEHTQQVRQNWNQWKAVIYTQGFLLLLPERLKQSSGYFENASESDATNLSCLVGKGLIEYHKNNYKDALFYFKNCFKYYRRTFPQATYLQGLTYFKLEKTEQAEKCFMYFLKNARSDEDNISGLSALFVVYLKMKKFTLHYIFLINAFQEKGNLFIKSQVEDNNRPDFGQKASSFDRVTQIGNGKTHVDTDDLPLSVSKLSLKDPKISLYLTKHYFYKGEHKRAEKFSAYTLRIITSWHFEKTSEDSRYSSRLSGDQVSGYLHPGKRSTF
jgi:tetratricopeptide (TPR) repeat protein